MRKASHTGSRWHHVREHTATQVTCRSAFALNLVFSLGTSHAYTHDLSRENGSKLTRLMKVPPVEIKVDDPHLFVSGQYRTTARGFKIGGRRSSASTGLDLSLYSLTDLDWGLTSIRQLLAAFSAARRPYGSCMWILQPCPVGLETQRLAGCWLLAA